MTNENWTLEKKIRNLCDIARAVGSMYNSDGPDEEQVERKRAFALYEQFCDWRHNKPDILEAISFKDHQHQQELQEKEQEFVERLGSIMALGHEQSPLWDAICELSIDYQRGKERTANE